MVTSNSLLANVSGGDLDPVVGTWKLNRSRSQLSRTTAGTVSRTYTPVTDGMRVSETRTDGHGQTTEVEFTSRYDGKEHPVWILAGDSHRRVSTNETIAIRRIDGHTADGTGRENGKIKYRFRRTVSQNGQRLSVEITDTSTPGAPSRSVLVYDRVNAQPKGRQKATHY